ncbi:probable inactive poly [ADP-ribose] polymerase SRO2 isoform X2 [Amborella trichopoda]|nr:probable inactive poly [ADP-ribose] polymerase SRO2 isoform X2 [Amborella trichopoda]XP_020523293.1 probable inactive poly [ADP-ribose] polymerase SRO2 isoform X2 [Amborella trichopoda]|eukprot:XP_020523292.1 probable inactive poly [ADP-ribose] polymerase SRO2 isoform X2 [Amborella trichopoda]
MSYTGVVSIHKISHSSFSGQARLQAFSLYSDAIAKKCGGDANIRYAWHGSGKDGVSQVILHGFGLCNRPEGKGANGVGIYLSPEGSSIDSLVYSNVDDDGQQHMLLCRVIMGNMELVPTGSEQFHPSSEEFDSGVDNPITPSRYIVWSTHMNTHILPEYVVSFKVSHPHLTKLLSLRNWKADSMESLIASNPHVFGNSPGKWMQLQQKKPAKVPFVVAHHVKGESAARKPSSAWMPFPRLISVLAGILPPSSISLIEKYHTSYLEKRITRECMIKKVRQIAGDKVLVAAIKSYRSKQLKELAHQRTPFPRQSNSTDPGSCTSENTISTADSRTH